MQKQTKMLQFRRTFENEQIQLQDLNTRLRQYLSRVKDLEQDNALLIKEINTIKQQRTAEWEKKYLTELRELRNAANQLTLEKSKAEMEREKLGRELQTIQALCCEETVIYRNIEGERKGCEKQLQQGLKKNAALEERLVQLENEYVCLEDAHRKEISHLSNEVYSRAMPVVVTQNGQGRPAVTMEEIEEYSHMMAESLNENFEVYCRRIDDMEDSIKANQAKLEDLHREKTQYVSELKKLREEAHKQNELQLHLEDQIVQIQDRFYLEMDQYQGIIGELEEERREIANTIAEKLREYQQLMQVKMGLSLEVATYRALLEGERKDPVQKMDQYGRETSRRIDIKMPAQPWSTATRQEVRKQYPEARYTDLASSLKASFGSTNIRSTSPARLIPISISGRDQQSAPARRDTPSFTKGSHTTTNVKKTTVEERSAITKGPLQKPTAKDTANQHQPGLATRSSPAPAPRKDKTTVVTTSTESTLVVNGKGEGKHDLGGSKVDKTEGREEKDANKVTVKEWKTPDREDVRKRSEVQNDGPEEVSSSERLPGGTNIQKIIVEERTVRTKEPLQKPAKDSANQRQQGFTTSPGPGPEPMMDNTTIVTPSTESTIVVNAKGDSEHDFRGPNVEKTEGKEEKDANKGTVKDWMTPGWEDVRTSNVPERSEVQSDIPGAVNSSEKLPATTYVQKTIVEERSVRSKEPLQKPVKDSTNQSQPGFATTASPGPEPMKGKTTVLTTSTESTFAVNAKEDSEHDFGGPEVDKTEDREEKDASKVTVKEWTTPDWADVRTSNVPERSYIVIDPDEAGSSDEKMVDYIYMEEIIEKVMRPAGLDTKFISSSPDSKVAYRMEKTEDEDGKTKTQIILETRVEEDMDVSDDSVLEELLSKGVKKVALDDIKGTPTGSAIENLLSLGHHGGAGDLKNKSVNVEIIEEPGEDRGNGEGEANPTPTFQQPSSMFFQIEELDDDSHGTKLPEGKTEVSKPTPNEETGYQKEESAWVREGYREADDPYFSHAQETEYFVSTPDESISESEEERGISSYGHYGVVDDLSDERYYQEVPPINPRFEEDKGYRSVHRSSYMTSELGFSKDRFPECIIEEEVQVSPTVQESVLELLKEDSMDPKQQLRGALDKLQGNVSVLLQDELSHVTENDQEGASVDVKKVPEVLESRTVELKELDDSDLLEDSETEEQVLVSSHPSQQHSTSSKTVRKYTVKIIKDQEAEPQSAVSTAGLDVFRTEESADDVHKTERVIRLGPSERSLTFQMDIGNDGKVTSLPAEGGAQEFQGFVSESLGAAGSSGGEGHKGVYSYVRKTTVSYDQGDEPSYSHGHGHEGEARKWDDLTRQQVEYGRVLQTQFFDPQLKISEEKKIATVFLDSVDKI
ncbi:synemin [Conger conger]|uniref:synemin n=1 Tax=Conger conger TaxID=82655 RepID=UPI002A59BB10|nr:synemin [Conger conger]